MTTLTKQELQEELAHTKKEVRLIEGDLSNSRHRVRNLLQKWAAQAVETQKLRSTIAELRTERKELREAHEEKLTELRGIIEDSQKENTELREKRHYDAERRMMDSCNFLERL